MSDEFDDFIPCTPKFVPDELASDAAAQACNINPCNAPLTAAFGLLTGLSLDAEHIAVLTSKYWGAGGVHLTVSFLDNPPVDLRARIISHMNAWAATANVKFSETAGQGQVRIARQRGDGYWSYLGVDVLSIPASQATMNLDSFTMSTPESEFKRVIRHETGHTLGFPHEHMRKELVSRLDRAKTIAWGRTTLGWSQQMVIQQILTPLDEASLMSTPADQTSIMCYQLPGSITIDGRPIIGGTDIDPSDALFAAKIYPGVQPPPPPPPPPPPVTSRGQVIVDDVKGVVFMGDGWAGAPLPK